MLKLFFGEETTEIEIEIVIAIIIIAVRVIMLNCNAYRNHDLGKNSRALFIIVASSVRVLS